MRILEERLVKHIELLMKRYPKLESLTLYLFVYCSCSCYGTIDASK